MSNDITAHDYIRACKNLDLMHTNEHTPGFAWWHPNGVKVLQSLQSILRRAHYAYGYEEVKTPNMASSQLFKKSGHLDKFKSNMFFVQDFEDINSSDNFELDQGYCMRPMSCPNHISVYQNSLVSYNQLPLSLFEFGEVVRNEPSGSLQTLFRMRGFCQDDSHVFVRRDAELKALSQSISKYIRMAQAVYEELGFSADKVSYQISLRPEQRFGDDSLWNQAENSLRLACKELGLSWIEAEGGGAFYGPKLEIHIKDKLGRSWQCGTVQVDFVLPKRFDLEYVEDNNERTEPIIVHHAVLGSLERFIGILLENYGEHLPFKLKPVQVCIVPIKAGFDLGQIINEYVKNGIRYRVFNEDEHLNNRIKKAQLTYCDHIVVIGQREIDQGIVNVRHVDGSKQVMSLQEYSLILVEKIS